MDAYKKKPGLWRAQALITAAEQATVAAKTVKSANHQVFVQRITLSIGIHANGKVALTVQSSNATPVIIATRTDLTAAAGVPDQLVWDFGPDGIAMLLGESVHWLGSTGGTGVVGKATMEGYEQLVGPVAQAVTN